MSLLRIFQALMILSLVHGGSIWAATYWVSKTGSDSNPCFASNTQPNLTSQSRRTIMAGAACLSQGDTLMIMPGNYNEWVLNALPNHATMRGADANPNNWPSVRPSNNVVPNGRGAITHNQDRTNISYRFIRIDLSQITSGNKPSNCFNTQNSGTSFTFEDFECIGPAPGMFYQTGSAFGVSDHANSKGTVRRGVIRDFDSGPDGPGAHGFYWRGPNGLVENVWIENLNGRCVNYRYRAHNNIFRYSVCKNVSGISAVTSPREENSGHVIHNSIFWNTGRIEFRNSSGQSFYNNVVFRDTNTGTNCIRLQDGNHVVRNNILLNCGGTAISDQTSGSTVSHNLTKGNPSDIFTNHKSGDFSLKVGSVAIDAGVTISGITRDFVGTTRPQGCCYDIGAFEYVLSGSSPAAPSNLQTIAK